MNHLYMHQLLSALRPAKALTLVLLLSLAGLSAFAEGTPQVMPNSANGVGLYVNPSLSAGPYRNANSENRIRFLINDHTAENFYFGVRFYNRAATPAEVPVYFRILNSAGVAVAGPTQLSTAPGSAGRIETYAQAVAGPNYGSFTGGYTPRTFDPTVNGEYSIEFYESNDAGASALASQANFSIFFDLTVGNATQRLLGRVHSQAWSLITYSYNASNLPVPDLNVPMQSTFYGYTDDQTVSKVTFNDGFKPLAAVIAMNRYGAVYSASATEWYAGRRSQNTGATAPTFANGYKLFLTVPSNVYPRSAAPSTPTVNSITGCPGAYTINYTISATGDVAVLLDLNGTDGYQHGTSDRILNDTSRTAGTGSIAWDGRDGLGNLVSAASAEVTFYLRRGRTNLPIFDAEQNVNGFSVTGHEPVVYTPRLFWNDTILVSVGNCSINNGTENNTSNTTGKGVDSSVNGMAQVNLASYGFVGRGWNGSGNTGQVPSPANGLGTATSNNTLCDDYGNIRTLNTWWWANETSSGESSYALPDCRYIAGTVFNDVNAGTIGGTAISTASGTQLYVYIVNTVGNTVVAKQTLTNGSFAFGAQDGVNTTTSTYRLVLSTVNVNVGAATPASTLPTGWVSTGEGLRNSSGDGTGNGVYTIGSAISNYTYFDFGIEALPTPTALTTAASQSNPGGTNTVTIPAATFSGTDAVDVSGGQISYIHVTTFPTNTTTINFASAATTVNGAPGALSYNSGNFPAGGVFVATNTVGNPTSAITVDPVNGGVNVDITYKVVDQALQSSTGTGIARQPLTDITISGSVYNDPAAGTINGTLISSAGGPLFVNLVNTATNTVVSSKPVTGGTYSFSTADNLQNNVATYQLVLAGSATATTGTLPSPQWVNTAEGLTGTTGDGTANGAYSFGANVTANTVVDFGLDALPVPTALTTATSQTNPGGTNSVTVPAATFSGTDADAANGGTLSYLRVTALPTNATSITLTGSTTIGGPVTTSTYNSGNFPAGGVYVAVNTAGNPTTAVLVDPLNGAVNVDISYRLIDNAGKESTTSGVARQPLAELQISGSVYNDPDGGIINGTLRNNAGGPLFVNLVSGGSIVASKPVSAAGTYSFTTGDGLQGNVATYSLVLTRDAVTATSILPSAAFTYTAEGVAGTTGDGTANGVYTFGANVTNNAAIDFGIDALPTVTALNTATSQVNPGGTTAVTVPATTFSGADAGDLSGGQVSFIRITAFPANATTVSFASAATTLGGVAGPLSYNSGNFPAGGVYVATNSSGNPLTAITVDPVNGAVNVDFTYATIDNAGKQSAATGTARQPLTDLTISGTVYNDANAGIINGSPISNAGGPLYVNVINTDNNTVVASQLLTNGTFSFGTANGLQSNVTTYGVVLTTSATSTTAALPNPNTYVNTAEGVSGTTGDANANGRYLFGGALTSGAVIDFGIDALPTPAPLTTATSQVNPGGTATVTIPATTFSATDNVDISGGQVNYIHIISFPTNTTTVFFANAATSVNGTYGALSYTSATFPAGGVYVATNTVGNPTSAISVDPLNGAVNVDFTYNAIDNAGAESSTSGIARQPLTDLTISGSVYDDVNGGTINGDLISNAGGQLYVNLVNTANNTVVASKAVTNGTFSFSTADGLQNNVGTYNVVLAASASATTASLPTTGWVNMAEGITPAGDGAANGTYTFGANVTTSQVVNFAIEALPVPATLTTAAPQVNPGGTNTVTIPAATFSATDNGDISGGAVSYIHITAFPTNTTTVNFASAATSVNGTYGALSYNSGNFPAGGVYVATNTVGNPTSAITVDPVNGAVNVDFTYTAIDNSGKESVASGIARQPLTDLTISGTLFNDANGTKDGLINGTATGNPGGTLHYANLVNTATNQVVASQALPIAGGSTGTFSFGSANGVESGTSYAVVIATTNTATTGSVTTGWVNTAEDLSGNAGDGTANGIYTVGAITMPVVVNFGVNALPTVTSTTITAQANPGGNTPVTVPAASFASADADANGGIAYVRLTGFPTNANSITVIGSLTAGGPVITATYNSGNFPGSFYLATNNSGNLLPVDALKIDPADGAVSAVFPYSVIDIAGYESATTANTTVPFITGAISGTVYNDFNALADNLINGTGTNLAGQLYVNALNGSNVVVATAVVAADGTYVITGLGNGTYTLQLSNVQGTVTAAAPATTLPSGWAYVGEGTAAAGDGTPNGLQSVTLTSNGVAGANFGIDGKPVANSLVAATLVNPGGTNLVTIPAATFSGSDIDAAAGGEIEYVRITAFPTNATTITVTGSLSPGGLVTTTSYDVNTFPGSIYIATNDDGSLANANAFRVDPVNGAVTVVVSFKVIDNAGQESNNTATASQPLSDLLISGNVYNDVNAGIINGTLISNANGQLFVNLVDTTANTVVASKLLTDGTFAFGTANGVQNNVGSYKLVLAATAIATTPALPNAGWVNTAEGISGTSGDGAVNGAYSFGAVVTTSQTIDFGIDALPTAVTAVAASQTNPGGTNNVTIPATAFSGTDADAANGGILSYVLLTGFPTNATSITVTGATSIGGTVTTTTYTSGTFPTDGIYIATAANGNLSAANAVQVDPVNGAVTVVLPYAVIDNAGKRSANTATVSQPLTELTLSGNVYNDANGGNIDGNLISNAGGQLYVNLVNTANNSVVASKTLTNGTFTFTTADGLEADVTTYHLVLADEATATVPALPAPNAWANTAEGISGTAGDGIVNGRYVFGGAVTSGTVIDFGIDALPVPAIITTATTQVNPGGTTTVTIPATTFSAADNGDIAGGQVNYIRILSFPTNATTISFANAATSVNGTYGALSYNSGNFPAGGVYVATNTVGNPTGAITVDPVNGAVNVDIVYHAIDNAGKESTTTGTARQPLSDLLLTGNVYDDVNGGLIDGIRISNANGQLFVNLVDTALNLVIASKELTDGTFSFGTGNGLRSDVATYKLVLTNTAIATTAGLPSPLWVNTAEGLSGTNGDGSVNGGYATGIIAANTTVDFGIDARPIAVPVTVATPKVNPGGNIFIPIANNLPLASDPIDIAGGQVTYLRVLSLPVNATAVTVNSSTTLGGPLAVTTYTSGNFPAGGIYVATNATGSTLDSFYIDPVDGADTVRIQFRAIDQAGVESGNIGVGKIPISELTISGNVYNDVNGNTDGIINGALISNAGGPLYVNLVDGNTNTVVSSKPVAGGAFSFSTADGLRSDVTDYRLVLADDPGATAPALPNATAWLNTGEGLGTSADGLPNGRYTFSTVVTSPVTVSFGIDARPVPAPLTVAPSQQNPGGTAMITILATMFVANDNVDISGGEVRYIHIKSFPTHTTTVNFASAATTVDGTYGALSYTAATFPAGGVFLATNATGNPAGAITVDPTGGAGNIDFTFSAIDQAGAESVTTGIARQTLTDITITGTVYDDATAGIIDGTPTGSAGGQLYVNLVNTANNSVIATKTISNGTFSFGTADGILEGVTTYALVLTNAANSSTATLPSTGWVYTAEGLTGTNGDGTRNGTFAFGGALAATQVIDFGVDALPIPADNTAATQVNPGGTTLVTVPATAFSATDPDLAGGQVNYVHITAFPTNATSVTITSALNPGDPETTASYNAGNFPAGGIYIATAANGNLANATAVQVDPIDGAVTVDFTYTAVDNAGEEGIESATASQPFSTLLITGTLFNDFNGLTDGAINGIAAVGTGLYVNVLNASNAIVASTQIGADGTYSIGGLNPGDYTLVLTSDPASTTASVNAGWVITGEGVNTSADGTVNGRQLVSLVATNLSGLNFAVNSLPVADLKTYVVNPNTSNAVDTATVVSTANNANSYLWNVVLSGTADNGNTPGALTGSDANGNNGTALTLGANVNGVSVVIDPASYSGTRNGAAYANALMLEYNGIQLQPGGCQGGNAGNPGCALYNSTSGKWEIPAYDLAGLKLLIRNGTTTIAFDYAWKDAAGFTGSTNSYAVAFTQSLPVRLLTFTADKRGNTAALRWTAENEVNFEGYEVERSTDGRTFSRIGTVAGTNATTVATYNYNDDLSGITANRVYYRLKQVDVGGAFSYSPIVSIGLNNTAADVTEVRLMKNPVRSTQVRLQVKTTIAGTARFLVIDNGGRIVLSRQERLSSGTTALSLELPGFLANGTYTVVTEIGGATYPNKVLLDK
ncbi:hypothetical protein [Flaviaesturariibacter amylovorans]|uniref:T9SS type B sorting domain-containing protein n=1 Tax=Flaviaesturariibacter amylovorans TaxID=1084520 RepID=A0ABP8HDL7_9BACT